MTKNNDTALLSLEEIAEKILDAADYFQSAADQGEGFLASKIVDPLMICHGELLERAARLHCPVCGYTKKDAALHGDHGLCSNKNPPWNTRANPTTPQNAEALEALDNLKAYVFNGSLINPSPFFQTIRAALNQPRTVKPLVWEKQLEQLVAKVPFDREYAIIKVGGKFTLYFPEAGVYRVNFGSEDDAKAVAEAHWQAKIGECLV